MLWDLYRTFEFDPFLFLIGAAGCILLLSKIYFSTKGGLRNGLRKPPGPKGWPLIGNLLDMPKSHQYLTYMEWRKKYGEADQYSMGTTLTAPNVILGDVIGVNVCGQPIVILNSRQAVHDLLVKRSAIYSNRPQMEVLNKWFRAVL